jgi:hypothetical protein
MPGPWFCPRYFDKSFFAADLARPSKGANINIDGNLGGCVAHAWNLASCSSFPVGDAPENAAEATLSQITDVYNRAWTCSKFEKMQQPCHRVAADHTCLSFLRWLRWLEHHHHRNCKKRTLNNKDLTRRCKYNERVK